jgi:hypothetical protein
VCDSRKSQEQVVQPLRRQDSPHTLDEDIPGTAPGEERATGERRLESGQLIQEERLRFQTGPGVQEMRPLDLQQEVVVDDIDTDLPTSLINRMASPPP